MFRRPSRTALAIGSLAISVALAAAALATQRTLQLQTAALPSTGGPSGALQAVADHAAAHRIGTVVDLFFVMFAIIGAVNLVLVASFAARDTATKHSILRTIGFTPAQTTVSLITTQAAAGTAGSILGIPLGILLFRGVYAATNKSSLSAANPPITLLIALAVTAVLAAAVLAAGPAVLISRRPVTSALTTE